MPRLWRTAFAPGYYDSATFCRVWVRFCEGDAPRVAPNRSREGVMDVQALESLPDELERFASEFDSCVKTSPTRAPVEGEIHAWK